MKRKITLLFVLVIVLLAAAFLTVGASAQDEPVFVYVFADGATYEVTTEDTLDLGWAWLAMTKGQINVFVRNSSSSFVLTDEDGNVVLDLDADESRQIFEPPFWIPPEDVDLDCPMPRTWLTLWDYFQDPLPEGTYTLESSQSFDTPVNDGFHVCYDLFVDPPEKFPAPSLYTGDDNFTAIVTIEVSEP